MFTVSPTLRAVVDFVCVFICQILDHEVKGSLGFEEMKDGLAKMFTTPMLISFDDWERMTDGMALCNIFERVEEAQFHIMIRNEIRTYVEASISKGMRVTSRGSFENAAVSALRILLIRMDRQDSPRPARKPEMLSHRSSVRYDTQIGATIAGRRGSGFVKRGERCSESSEEGGESEASQEGRSSPPTLTNGRRIARAAARAERIWLGPVSERMSSLRNGAKNGDPAATGGGKLLVDVGQVGCDTRTGLDASQQGSLLPRARLIQQLQMVLDEKSRQRQQLIDDNAAFRELRDLLICMAVDNTSPRTLARTSLHANTSLSPGRERSASSSRAGYLPQSPACESKHRWAGLDGESRNHVLDCDRECVTVSERPWAEFGLDLWCDSSASGPIFPAPEAEPSRPCVCLHLVMAVLYPSLKALEIQVLEGLREAHCCPRYDQVSAREQPSSVAAAYIGSDKDSDEALTRKHFVELWLHDTDDLGPMRCSGEKLAEVVLQNLNDDRARMQLPWCNVRVGKLVYRFPLLPGRARSPELVERSLAKLHQSLM